MNSEFDLSLDNQERFARLEDLFSHVWMVRTFIRHCEEAEDDDELNEVQRVLYDAMHSLGQFSDAANHLGYFKQVKKKLARLRDASRKLSAIQPKISSHTNFKMAERSLRSAINEIEAAISNH